MHIYTLEFLDFRTKWFFALLGIFLVHDETEIFDIISKRTCYGGVFGDNSGISVYFSIKILMWWVLIRRDQ